MARRCPEPWEFELLRLLSEQYGMPFDQLARFLGCDDEQASRVARHLHRIGYADYGRFLVDEPHWVWLTSLREQGGRGRRPNAVVEIGGERHAILVKYGHRCEERSERDLLESLMRGYDALIAFCSRGHHGLYRRLAAEHHWPKLVVRDIPVT